MATPRHTWRLQNVASQLRSYPATAATLDLRGHSLRVDEVIQQLNYNIPDMADTIRHSNIPRCMLTVCKCC